MASVRRLAGTGNGPGHWHAASILLVVLLTIVTNGVVALEGADAKAAEAKNKQLVDALGRTKREVQVAKRQASQTKAAKPGAARPGTTGSLPHR